MTVKCCKCRKKFPKNISPTTHGVVYLINGDEVHSMTTKNDRVYYCCKKCLQLWDNEYRNIYYRGNANWQDVFFNRFLKDKSKPNHQPFIFR
jgi:hypothetical protein